MYLFRGKVRSIHFIGIGGSGMNGIAEVLLNLGFNITGSDLKENYAVKRLKEMGAKIYIGHNPKNVEGADVVVYSSAVKEDNIELVRAKELGIPTIPRGEMLAELMRFKYGIAISGSHGKTTTTSMVGSILSKTGYDPTVVIGGKLEAYGSNAKLGRGEFLVAEADESDGSFLKLTPTIVSINNIDKEHLSFYRDFENIKNAFIEFANKVPFYGAVAVNVDDSNVKDILPKLEKKVIKFGINSDDLNVKASDIKLVEGRYKFKVNDLGYIHLSIPGKHNIYNALASISIALELGVPFCVIKEVLENFKNASRRFDIKYNNEITIIDDYAHHPTELIATIRAAKDMYKSRRIISVFQPHRYSRLSSLYNEFTKSFNNSDMVIITDVYSAGEEKLNGISGKKLSEDIKKFEKNKEVIYSGNLDDTFKFLKQVVKEGDVILFLGAGSITKLADKFSNYLSSRE